MGEDGLGCGEKTESEEGKSYIIEIEFQFCALNYLFLKRLIF